MIFTIIFYANDIGRNVGNSQVSIVKDIDSPIITINHPSQNQNFVNSPAYEILILESHLETIWYTIDNGLNNYTITEMAGIIDSVAWGLAPFDPITIRFYARDLAGDIGTSYIIVVKILEQQQPHPSPPALSGYNLSLLIGLFGMISVLLIRKRSKF